MTTKKTVELPRMVLAAETAEDVMTPNPVSIRDNITVREAVAHLLDHGFSAAPVIDEAGKPVGVISRSDILTHNREKPEYVAPVQEGDEEATSRPGTTEKVPRGFQIVDVNRTRVREIMTPVVFCVARDYPARKVVDEILSLKVHRLFVVDRVGVLIGVISTVDLLRCLR